MRSARQRAAPFPRVVAVVGAWRRGVRAPAGAPFRSVASVARRRPWARAGDRQSRFRLGHRPTLGRGVWWRRSRARGLQDSRSFSPRGSFCDSPTLAQFRPAQTIRIATTHRDRTLCAILLPGTTSPRPASPARHRQQRIHCGYAGQIVDRGDRCSGRDGPHRRMRRKELCGSTVSFIGAEV